MKKALILLGHADPASFNRTVATAYQEGFRAAGGEAALVTLSDLQFDPVLRHGFRGDQALEPDLLELRARIEAADHLVWVFPTYWVSPPAIVRALVDRLFLPGWAFAYEPGKALPDGLLAGRSARVLTTMDSPSWWYALWHYRAIHGAFVNGTLRFVGLAPVKLSAFYATRTRTAAQRERWLAEVQATAAADHARCPDASRRPPGRPEGRAGALNPALSSIDADADGHGVGHDIPAVGVDAVDDDQEQVVLARG